jgi:hypothetical protein
VEGRRQGPLGINPADGTIWGSQSGSARTTLRCGESIRIRIFTHFGGRQRQHCPTLGCGLRIRVCGMSSRWNLADQHWVSPLLPLQSGLSRNRTVRWVWFCRVSHVKGPPPHEDPGKAEDQSNFPNQSQGWKLRQRCICDRPSIISQLEIRAVTSDRQGCDSAA